ncbi:MAG: hypothetical protein C0605_05980 [Hyphomicrobiales bacterium]|nr:MAG: hypothetical protein C0605_05980 [Hyphomicrobiales bacterium]
MSLRRHLGESYSPMYFLASLGAGGLSVSFFVYLLYMMPHKGSPIPTFNHMAAVFTGNDLVMQVFVGAAALMMVLFGLLHYRLLVWNFMEFAAFRKTPAYETLRSSNAEVQLMAIPLTVAMAINVGFAMGALFVPNLWEVREVLFPFALVAFGATAVYAVLVFLEYFSRILVTGHFDCEKNNSLAQMLSIFAFSMLSVGFAAPGAMSHSKTVSGIGLMLAITFASFAVLFGVVKIVLGFRAMFNHGVNKEAAVSLWIVIPILTVLGIAFYRISMGLHHNFGAPSQPMEHAVMFMVIIALQIIFGLLGHEVLKRIGYYETFIRGEGKSVISYAAICPGVAFTVMGLFFINKGLVTGGMVDKFSITYFVLHLPLVYVQIKTILVLLHLNGKLLRRETKEPDAAAPAA